MKTKEKKATLWWWTERLTDYIIVVVQIISWCASILVAITQSMFTITFAIAAGTIAILWAWFHETCVADEQDKVAKYTTKLHRARQKWCSALKNLEDVNNCMLLAAKEYLHDIYACLGLSNKDVITLYLCKDDSIFPVASHSVSLCTNEFNRIYQEDCLLSKEIYNTSDVIYTTEINDSDLAHWTKTLLHLPDDAIVDPCYNILIGHRIIDKYSHRQIGIIVVRSLNQNTVIDTICIDQADMIFTVFLSIYNYYIQHNEEVQRCAKNGSH